ncbi:YicC/YloC family endoribonuclease [Candidatus Symbiobacter mobilis]|uniref:Stress-induction family protein n=1 Tax=Candidatus Symbiobacter mobilis CR TaxID=946483 RepID=U5N6G6_9BURK|nr:YicC/YloC family endoribonuclease [Candidatus Symbiobacter mobilis]AGX86855.1 stress-induction family protein [Candidatus Symbiobacter mobilis CR]
MPVYSMTGFASVQGECASWGVQAGLPPHGKERRLAIEIRSVNGRNLEMVFRLADPLRAFEPLLRERVQQRLQRGKVEIRASIDGGDATGLAIPSEEWLHRLATAQDAIRARLPQARELSVAEVLDFAQGEATSGHDWRYDVLTLIDKALDALLAARENEGNRLAAMLLDRTRQIRTLVDAAEPMVPTIVADQRQRFLDRWRDGMGLVGHSHTPSAVYERAIAESTAFALRIDVAEELTRLHSHLEEIERLLAEGGTVGKRLEFLVQELQREANTLGAKSCAVQLSYVAVDLKVLIEQMREQVQNLE